MNRNILNATIYGFGIIFLTISPAQAITQKIGQNQNLEAALLIDDTDVIFTGVSAGILNYSGTINRILSSVAAQNDGVGDININGSARQLNVEGDVGSATKAINQINFSDSGNLKIGGNLYAKNGVNALTGGGGQISFAGNNAHIDSVIGSSSSKFSRITIEGNNVDFVKNLFASRFDVLSDKSAVFNSSLSNLELGNLQMFGNGSLTFNSSADLSTLANTSSDTINIAANKKLIGTGLFSINGNLNLGLFESNASGAIISSAGNIAVDDNSKINFDYSGANFLKNNDQYNFLTSSATLTANETLLNDNITDNSILLSPSITKVVDGLNQSLRVTQNIDNNTIAKLNNANLASVNFLLGESENIDPARTALLKISTQAELENALATLQVDNNNMIQRTSADIATAIENIIEYRLQSLNYEQSGSVNLRDLIRSNRRNQGKIVLVKSGGLWGEVFGAQAKQSDNTSKGLVAKGYDADFSGITFGLDQVVKNNRTNSIWGGTISYAIASAKSQDLSRQQTDIASYQLALYNHNIANNGLGWFNENFLSVGYNQYDSTRNINLESYQSEAQSKFSGTNYSAKIGFGYNSKISDNALFAPIVAIKYSSLQLADYQEKNPDGLGLKVENDAFNLTTSEVGFRMIGNFTRQIEPQINLSWLHNFNIGGAQSSSIFNGNQNKIKNVGVDLDSEILNAGVQLRFIISDDKSVTLKYDLQKSANFISNLGSLRFAWGF